ncbi:2Fe-2S iron-sulfur cluster-binding protein [Streptomyces sp. MMS24-I2-30]|uniref:2Fe-2S iron-sulfur cluster-binding protein n=1 Tax=Streptomyces sp. MMS24-I2-30 TaxID=3351564 RepID=UPI0038969D8C
MTDDQHGENPPQAGGRWDPLPQDGYDDGATAFVKLPEGGVDALRTSDSPLAAPGHGYVPPPITVAAGDPGAGPAATGGWSMPADGVQWADPNAVPQDPGAGDRFTYHPAATQQWTYEDPTAPGAQAAPSAHAPGQDVTGQDMAGQDVTGQWSIPVAGGDLPDESGEFTTSSLVEQWGGTPPATLPGGAPAPWATEAAGQPWGAQAAPADQRTAPPRAGGEQAGGAPETAPEQFLPAEAYQDGPPAPAGPGQAAPPADGPTGHDLTGHDLTGHGPTDHAQAGHTQPGHDTALRPYDGHAPEAGPIGPGAAGPAAPAPRPTADHGTTTTAADLAGSGADVRSGSAPAATAEHAPARALSEADAPASHEPNRTAGTPGAAGPAVLTGPPGTADGAEEAAEGAAEPPGGAEATGAAGTGPEGGQTPATAAGSDTPSGDAEAEPAEPAEDAEDAEATVTAPHDDHPLASYVLRVNGADRPVTDAWIGESLLYVLRERLGLAGAKDGCSQGECGACNVQVEGRLVASCLVPAVTAAGAEVRTVEGLAADGRPSDVQRALAARGAVQCGFCVPGMAMTVHDLLEGNPAPTELEARQALCGNLCRCSGYRGVLDAVQEVVAERAALKAPDAEPAADGARIPHQAGPGAGGVHPSAFDAQVPPGPHDEPYEQPYEQPYGQDGGQA